MPKKEGNISFHRANVALKCVIGLQIEHSKCVTGVQIGHSKPSPVSRLSTQNPSLGFSVIRWSLAMKPKPNLHTYIDFVRYCSIYNKLLCYDQWPMTNCCVTDLIYCIKMPFQLESDTDSSSVDEYSEESVGSNYCYGCQIDPNMDPYRHKCFHLLASYLAACNRPQFIFLNLTTKQFD